MSGATVDGWEARHVRHRSSHRPRDGRPASDPPPSLEFAPAPVEAGRTWRQRVSDAFPMAAVSGVCFAIGLSLKAGSTGGPAPAFPIWTLFLALGCIAMLGAGASWVVGGAPSPSPPAVPLSRSTRSPAHAGFSSPSREVAGPAALGDEDDDALPAVNWEPTEPIMAKKAPRRNAVALPADDPLADLAELGAVDGASAHQVIEEIDRLLTDLKPAPTRGRPSA